MSNYEVTFEVFTDNSTKPREELKINTEAGNKKLAVIRAMQAINKMDGYSKLYKNVKKVEVLH